MNNSEIGLKFSIILLGIISISALSMLLTSNQPATGAYFEEIYGPINVQDIAITEQANNYPILPVINIITGNNSEKSPAKELLAPETLFFKVNKIPIPESNNYNYVTLRKTDIHTYSGEIGYYYQDPSKYLRIYLCTYAYKISRQVIGCERMQTKYSDGVLSFARGYTPDRYIAARAAGTDFGAFYIVASPEYGILGASPVAFIRWVSD